MLLISLLCTCKHCQGIQGAVTGAQKSEEPQGEAEAALWLVMNLTLGPSYLLHPSDAVPQGRADKVHFHTGFSMHLGDKDGPGERRRERLTWVSS